MSTTTDKTLVSWFCFDEETPKHCSVITVQAVDKYDALAFGQDAPGKWSTASDNNKGMVIADHISTAVDFSLSLRKYANEFSL